MLATLTPRLGWDILFHTWPVDFQYHLATATIIVSYFLLIVPYGLVRGKRQTWRITIFLLATMIVFNLLGGGHVIRTALAIGLFIALLATDSYFEARSDQPSMLRGYLFLVFGVGIVIVYALGGFLALFAHLHIPGGTQQFIFGQALPILTLVAFLVGAFQVLRPIAKALIPDRAEHQDVASLVHTYGTNSISYFALDADKSYFFSSSRKVAISYVLKAGVAVVAGDPIGPEEELYAATSEFLAMCRRQDWVPAFWQVRDVEADMYRELGLNLLKIGEDGIIHADAFTLKGKAMANVRTSARRAEKEGLRVMFFTGEIKNDDYMAQLQRISDAWLAEKGGSEMGFSMGRFEVKPPDEQITAIAIDGTERIHAFVTFLPIYGRNGWGLDLMRRAAQTAPGTMELLFSCSIDYLKGLGAEIVSLGLAPMGNVNTDDQSSLSTIIDFLTHRFGNLSQSQSLFKFKEKFHPTWESRYLVFTNPLQLPKVGLALYEAHQPDTSWMATLRASIQDWREKRQQSRAAAKETARIPQVAVHPGTGSLAL